MVDPTTPYKAALEFTADAAKVIEQDLYDLRKSHAALLEALELAEFALAGRRPDDNPTLVKIRVAIAAGKAVRRE